MGNYDYDVIVAEGRVAAAEADVADGKIPVIKRREVETTKIALRILECLMVGWEIAMISMFGMLKKFLNREKKS